MKKRFYRNLSIAIMLLTPLVIFVFKKERAIPNKSDNRLLDFITKPLQSSAVPKIDIEEAAKHQSSYIFLDSREREEYNVSHIKGATYVGYNEFSLDKVTQLPKDANIIIYCAVGVRSDKVAGQMIKAGYSNVYNLFGGIFEWMNEGNSVYNKAGYPTPYVHAYSRLWGTFLKSDYKVYDEAFLKLAPAM